MPSIEDKISYRNWQAIEAAVVSPLDRTPAYWKYVISSYLYVRSRLEVPGRAYDSEEHGAFAIGGAAHCDVVDLDQYIEATFDDKGKREVAAWMLDASQEKAAYWHSVARGSRVSRAEKRNASGTEAVAA